MITLRYCGIPTDTGLTITAQVLNPDGTVLAASVSCADTSGTACYVGSLSAPAAGGPYLVRFLSGGTTCLAIGAFYSDGAAEVDGLTASAIKAKTDALPAWPANLSALAITAGGAVTAGTVSDKSGYSLSAAYDAAKTAAQPGDAMAVTGDFSATMKASITTAATAATPTAAGVSGNVTGSVGSVAAAVTLPAIPAGWITAAGIAAGALNGKGDWSTYAGGDTSGTTTLLSRLTPSRAGYLDNLAAGPVALSAQIPAAFTSGLFSAPGVFSVAALANAPGGEAANPWTATREVAPGVTWEYGALVGQLYVAPVETPVVPTPAPPPGPDEAYVYVDAALLGRGRKANLSVSFTLSAYPAVSGWTWATDTVTMTTDADGRAGIYLPVNSAITPADTFYRVNSVDLGFADAVLTLAAEDAGQAVNLARIIA